jgi:hypothetical protein
VAQEGAAGVRQTGGDPGGSTAGDVVAPLPRRPSPESTGEPDGRALSHPDGGDGRGRRPGPDVLRNVLVALRRLD